MEEEREVEAIDETATALCISGAALANVSVLTMLMEGTSDFEVEGKFGTIMAKPSFKRADFDLYYKIISVRSSQ